ncbi:hypothetical protein GZL_05621 [Streptomyces sp. 769]|nr:hypothetical protein GZL_05621 [Streptomyces sp. 769]
MGCLYARHVDLQGWIRDTHLPCGDFMVFVLIWQPE